MAMTELRPQIESFLALLVAAAGVAEITLDILGTAPLRIAATLNVPGASAADLKALITAKHFMGCWVQQWPENMHGSCDLGAIQDACDAIILTIRFASVRLTDA